MARRKLSPEERKTRSLRIPISEGDYNIITAYCERNNMEFAGWARIVLLKAIQDSNPIPQPEYMKQRRKQKLTLT